MMGIKQRAFGPIEHVTLEELIPSTQFYRHVEQVRDLSFVRNLVQSCYAAGGRPSIDPVVFFKLQLIRFFEGIRSERQLMRVAADRLSLRWYLGYDLHEPLPDHSSLTRIRDRYGVERFRHCFDRIVEQCHQHGLVWGKELSFDSTQVEANADRHKMLPRFYVDAVPEHLAALFPAADPRSQQQPVAPDTAPSYVAVGLSSDVEAALAAKNAARHDWMVELGRQQRNVVHGDYQRHAAIWANTTDPDATIRHKKGGGVALGYHTHYAVDGGTARIILRVLVTPSQVMDNQPMQDLLWHSRFRWQLPLAQVTGDTKYGTAENIVAIEEAGLRAYRPLTDYDTRSSFFGKHSFAYAAARNLYTCPGGAELPLLTAMNRPRVYRYQAAAATCNACALKARCTDSTHGRTVTRSFDEAYLERVRTDHTPEAGAPWAKKALRQRKVWVEPLFGEAKQWHGVERFRLRRLEKVNKEALVTATGQNRVPCG